MTEAEIARDEALKVVLTPTWAQETISLLMALPEGMTGSFEEFRLRLVSMGAPEPAHHNAWGALAMSALRKGVLEKTGEFTRMKTLRSHARNTPVLVRV